MHFDPSINFGNILMLVALLISLVSLHRSNIARMDETHREAAEAAASSARLESKFDVVWEWFERNVIHRRQ